MKRILFIALAVLFIAGTASATVITNPKAGPSLEVTSVYNNSGGDLEVGTVVIWDIDSSTGDDDNYVNTSTTESDLVAGVVYGSSCITASACNIVTRGPVDVDLEAGANGNCAADALLCVGSVAGDAQTCTTVANNKHAFARCVATGAAGGTVKAYVHAN